MKINRSVREIIRQDANNKCEKARLLYVVSDCTASADALAAASAAAPEKLDSALKQSIELVTSPGGGLFEVAVNYALPQAQTSSIRDSRQAGDRLWKFAVHGTSGERSTALETITSVAAGNAAAADPGVLIDWNGKCGQESASGSVRVLEPVFTESCRATFKLSSIDTAYKRRIAALVGKVNSDTFHHWSAGELLLESIVQSDPFTNSDGDELCDVVFTFAIRPNGKRSCAGSQVDNVDGWDYLWAVTETVPGSTAPQVRSLHVSRIYERSSFSALGV